MSEQGMSRRAWLTSSAAAVVAGAAVSGATFGNESKAEAAGASPADVRDPQTPASRRETAFRKRLNAAEAERDRDLPTIKTNGDEDALPGFIASFAKTLPHNTIGEPSPVAYLSLLNALASGDPAVFEQIQLGGVAKLANPQAAYAYDLEGADSHHQKLIPPPKFSSAEEAGELVELYWQALTRDVSFADYATDPLTIAAAADINRLSNFKGPRIGGAVTPGTLFRGNTPGDVTGPYVSQLMYRDVPYGATTIPQRYTTVTPGIDFLTTERLWLNAVSGGAVIVPNTFDTAPRYIRNARDIGEYVHRDWTYQTYLSSALMLLTFGPAALDPNNPYLHLTKQGGGVTFGSTVLLDLLAKVGMLSSTTAFYWKWIVHRRLRPEEFGGRAHFHLTGAANYPIHRDLVNSDAVNEVFNLHGTYFLPVAYAEGCPPHPAYPAAHAVIAGACCTILKAFFNEDFVWPNPVVPAADGLSLTPYTGGTLTLGNELNKLAANISIARNGAGVHRRSDGIEGMNLGEEVAISVLRDRAHNYNEPFAGYQLTKFNGQRITIG